jgi:predicted transcriptional regulator
VGASPTRSKPPRGAYREDFAIRLEALDAKRQGLGITQKEWAARANLDPATVRRMLNKGQAFKRTVNALTLALRELEKEQRRQHTMFRIGGAA